MVRLVDAPPARAPPPRPPAPAGRIPSPRSRSDMSPPKYLTTSPPPLTTSSVHHQADVSSALHALKLNDAASLAASTRAEKHSGVDAAADSPTRISAVDHDPSLASRPSTPGSGGTSPQSSSAAKSPSARDRDRELARDDDDDDVVVDAAASSPSTSTPPPSNAWSLRDFRIFERVGSSRLSVVHRAQHASTGMELALKCYLRSKLDAFTLNQIRREIEVHASVSDPSICAFYGSFEDDRGNVYLLHEFARRGDVFSLFGAAGGTLSEERTCREIIRPVTRAVAYLHQRGIAHRDIKPENLLAGEAGAGCKLTDFGFAVDYTKNRLVTRLGTTDYMAPEIVLCDKARRDELRALGVSGYGPEVDIWAIGVLAYECLTGKAPFECASTRETYDNILRGRVEIPRWVSSEAEDFILGCLRKDPKTRFTARLAHEHEWVVSHCGGPWGTRGAGADRPSPSSGGDADAESETTTDPDRERDRSAVDDAGEAAKAPDPPTPKGTAWEGSPRVFGRRPREVEGVEGASMMTFPSSAGYRSASTPQGRGLFGAAAALAPGVVATTTTTTKTTTTTTVTKTPPREKTIEETSPSPSPSPSPAPAPAPETGGDVPPAMEAETRRRSLDDPAAARRSSSFNNVMQAARRGIGRVREFIYSGQSQSESGFASGVSTQEGTADEEGDVAKESGGGDDGAKDY